MISRTRLFFALRNNEYSGTPLILSPIGPKKFGAINGVGSNFKTYEL